MSLRRPRVIDYLGVEKTSGHLTLIVTDDEDWSDEVLHMELLQEKLDSYLAFVESGEVHVSLKEELGRTVPSDTPVDVRILAKYPASRRGLAFLDDARSRFRQAGVTLEYRVLTWDEDPT